MTRTEIINTLIRKRGYKSYLEIGVDYGFNFRAVEVENKVGVDPIPKIPDLVVATSDDFFALNIRTFDIIFVDGLHHADQVVRDIENALKFLNEGGTIVCHDMNPTTEQEQIVPQVQAEWTGDCWKAWVKLRSERSDLSMFVVATDYGCGVIQRGFQTTLEGVGDLTWAAFCENRKSWLNLVSIEEFRRKFESDFHASVNFSPIRASLVEAPPNARCGIDKEDVPEGKPQPRPLLSVLIPSVPSRLGMLSCLMDELQHQIGSLPVEVLAFTDNKKRTIGEKRDALVQMANGKYFAFCDDDDWPMPEYVEEIVTAIRLNEKETELCRGVVYPNNMVDVIVFNQQVSLNGKEFTVRFGLEYENEQANLDENGSYPSVVHRAPFHVCAWRSDLAKKYRFEKSQYGEDWAWSKQLIAEAKTQHRIEKTLHRYVFDDRVTEAF